MAVILWTPAWAKKSTHSQTVWKGQESWLGPCGSQPGMCSVGRGWGRQPLSEKTCHLSVSRSSSEPVGELTWSLVAFPLNCSPFTPVPWCVKSPAFPFRQSAGEKNRSSRQRARLLPTLLPTASPGPSSSSVLTKQGFLWQETSPVLPALGGGKKVIKSKQH